MKNLLSVQVGENIRHAWRQPTEATGTCDSKISVVLALSLDPNQ